MSEPNPTILDTVADPSVTDPLSEVTRRERRALLGSAVVGLAISAGGLVPEKIETFGITVTPQQEESLLFIMGGIIGYFWIAFAIYAWSDVKRRETIAARAGVRVGSVVQSGLSTYKDTQEKLKQAREAGGGAGLVNDPQFMQLAKMADQAKFAKKVQRVGSFRVAFDVYFPLVVGLTVIMVVWSSTREFPGWWQVAVGAVIASLAVGTVVLIRSWKRIRLWSRKRKSKKRAELQKRLLEKAKALPEDDPRRAELTTEAAQLFMKGLEDLKEGIY